MLAVRFWVFPCTLILCNALYSASPNDSEAKTIADSRGLLKDALLAEADGDLVTRDRLLNEAIRVDDKFDLALWQLGFIKLEDGKWCSVEKCLAEKLSAPGQILSNYESMRSTISDTIDGHWELAIWCLRNNLFDQRRAHAQRVLQFNSDHPGARLMLGFQRVSGQWVSSEQLRQFEVRDRLVRKALDTYGRQLTELARQFRAHKEQVRADARERLLKINDIAAIAPVEAIIGAINSDAAQATLLWLNKFVDPEATQSIARFALFHPLIEVQQGAAAHLKNRPLHDYVPELLQSLSSPVATLSVPVVGPNGTLAGFRQAFAQERQGQTDVTVLDTRLIVGNSRPRNVALSLAMVGGRNENELERATAFEAILRANERASQNSAAAQAENTDILVRNRRIARLLSEIADQEFSGEPREMWNWWDSVNETEHQSVKLPKMRYASTSLTSRDYTELAALNAALVSRSAMSNECFARGTLVATRKGMKAIESLRVGDLVLSRDISTGELSWKPVIQTTTRPPRVVYDISLDGEKLRCTGGHLFWVSGKGWTKASQLKPGDILHCASQPVVALKVDQLPEEQTFNLAVDRTQTYFVGKQLVLSHDVTDRLPTHFKVPGLSPISFDSH